MLFKNEIVNISSVCPCKVVRLLIFEIFLFFSHNWIVLLVVPVKNLELSKTNKEYILSNYLFLIFIPKKLYIKQKNKLYIVIFYRIRETLFNIKKGYYNFK